MLTTTQPPLGALAVAGERPLKSERGLLVTLYLGIPLCLAILLAWNPTGARAPLMPGYVLPTAYWLGILLPLWALLDACTRGLAALARRGGLRLPLPALLVAGALLATLAMRPYLIVYWELVDSALDPAKARGWSGLPGMFPASLAEFALTVRRAGTLLLLWVAINLFYVHFLGVARFGHLPARAVGAPVAAAAPDALATAAAVPPRGTPGFLARLPSQLGQDVIALQAQDHYLRVTTSAGSALILCRFSDAIAEMDATAGIRVHRSYWVARNAIKRLQARDGRHQLLLGNGERVPVSRTYLEQVRRQLH
jgi:hypothetical protein